MNLDANGEPAAANNGAEAIAERPSRAPHPPLSRGLLVAIGAVFAAALLGVALSPTLAVKYPLLLIALNPLPRHIIMVAPHTPMIPLIFIAAFRSLCSCIVSYEVGRHYGPRGIDLFERRSPRLAGFVRFFQRVFPRAAPVFLLVSPGPLTSTLAAVSGNSRWMTWSVSWCALLFWAFVNYKVGDWLRPYTAPILKFIQAYLLETTLVCIALVLGYQWFTRRRRLKQHQL